MKTLMSTIAITLMVCAVTSIAVADDFKTNNGKEFKNATVTQVEADGIVARTKTGIRSYILLSYPKMFGSGFTTIRRRQLPPKPPPFDRHKKLTDRQQNSIASKKDSNQRQGEQVAKQQNIQALANAYQDLLQQEEILLTQIGRIRNAKEIAWRKYVKGFYTIDSQLTNSSEANLPLLEGRLEKRAA